ncbi:MAG: SCP2 sterol-binding domain-containing protein [Gemmatimonadaceae bacterium]|nr:SCP2 sterol-binding domain-containing protein [Gemmatimonadaceae bacterium]
MTLRPFSPAWAAAFRAAVEDDAAYRSSAAGWTWPMAFVLDAAPELGYPDAVAVELALDRGRCHGATIVAADAVRAPFVLRAPYATWKDVVTGRLDPITGVTTRRIAVTGSMMTLMLHARAATALCRCAQAVPTHFPDEA